jgi:hypothetical protein
VSAAAGWKRMIVWATLRAMTAVGLRDMLWLHAERGDRRKQRQQAKDRHEEVQRFFHASKFDAVPNVFDTDWNKINLLFRFYSSVKGSGKAGKASYIVLTGANKK